MSGLLVIGVGNEWRGDDAAGLLAVRELGAYPPAGTLVRECDGEATALAALLAGAPSVIVADALAGGVEPGAVLRIRPEEISRTAGLFRSSTHGSGVAEAVALARSLGELPDRLLLFGIAGRCFDHGAAVTPAVAVGAATAARMIRAEIAGIADARWREPRGYRPNG